MAKEMIKTYNHGVEPAFLPAFEQVFERMVILVSMFATYHETAYCFGAIYSYEVKAILLKVWEELVAYLPEGMLPNFSEIPMVKMALDMMGGKMPEFKKEDLHPKLQSAYD